MRIVCALFCAGCACAANGVTPPVFPSQWSGRINEVGRQGAGVQVITCDMGVDPQRGGAGMVAYRNCGKSKAAPQLVFNFTNDQYGPQSRVYHINGLAPPPLPPSALGGGKCSYYCDSQGDLIQNIQESLNQIDYVKSAAYVNSTTINGTRCDGFAWADKLGPVAMNQLLMYVDAATKAPVSMHREITPFGKDKGDHIDTEWLSFAAGAPADALYEIDGLDKCPLGDDAQCPQGATTALDYLALFKSKF